MSQTRLRIQSHLKSIIKLVGSNDIVTIIAPTGTGKSLGIPLAVARTKTKIFISVPTIIAAISLSKTLSEMDPTIKVGYGAEGKITYDQETDVVYATSGHLRRKIMSTINDGKCQGIVFTDVLMIDEVHLRKADNDIIIGIWKYCRNQGINVPRMILATATPDLSVVDESAIIYNIPIESYSIDIRYITKTFFMFGTTLINDILSLIRELHLSESYGHFLVFVPGVSHINDIIRKLESYKLSKVILLPVYADLDPIELGKIYQTYDRTIRKIIISTNVSETSITIPDIRVVIDSLYEKRAMTSEIGGLRLESMLISKASAQQRCGRTGRTMPGICYRMTIKNNFNQLPDFIPPEILRLPITNYVMEFIRAGIDSAVILPTAESDRFNKTLSLLKRLMLIDQQSQITESGIFVTEFPLGVQNATILWKWIQLCFWASPRRWLS